MREVMANAVLVERESFETGSSISAVIPRRELEKYLHADDALGLWLDLAEDGRENLRLTVKLSSEDAREALRLSGNDDVVFAFDEASLQELADDPEVEAHGLRAALAVGVATAAIAAPAGLAANNPQVARTDANTQLAKPALTRQVVKPALKEQVARTAYNPQVARTALARQIHLVVLGVGVHVWR
ncbi:MAG TPA: hypothetical protein VFK76_08645 [Gaiellaceae bacterium]|nr:hypothetical protein [Gaiellaceae bacterium]